MRSDYEHRRHYHQALAYEAHHHVVLHARSVGSGGAWSLLHFSVGWLLAGLGYLLARLWFPVGLLATVAVVVLVGRVWGRRRLAAAGSWWELRPGERMSRVALEGFTRTLAGGLPRRLFGAAPWVALSVWSLEDRATCGLFISGGLSPAQVRASIEQALGSVTIQSSGQALGQAAGREGVRFRVASLAPVGSRFLPLRVDHRVDPAGQLLAALRAQEAGEGGVVQLVFQAPPRSASAKGRGQAARLRSGRGLQASGSLRVMDAVTSLLGGLFDAFTPNSPHSFKRRTVTHTAQPFSLERARAIDAKAGTPLLAATAGGPPGGGGRAAGCVGCSRRSVSTRSLVG
jgi:hypothetical protein